MELQYLIVFLILACIAGIIVRHVYRRISGKDSGYNCNTCPHHGRKCNCDNTHK